MNSIDDRALESAKLIMETLESELPEWTIQMQVQLGPGAVVFTAEVYIGIRGPKLFAYQRPFSFRDLAFHPRKVCVDIGVDTAMLMRRELKKAKKNTQAFGV